MDQDPQRDGQPDVPGPAEPGGVDANLGPLGEGLSDDPAYRGKTYTAAMVVGGVLLLALGIALLVAALT